MHWRDASLITKAILLIALCPFVGESAAQNRWWILDNRAYFEPLKADPRVAIVKILPLAYSNEMEYMQRDGSRLIWDMQLGKEIPFVGYSQSISEITHVSPGDWGAGLWLPVSFHMTLDHKDPSSPIINTDYRFKLSFKAQHAFSDDVDIGLFNLDDAFVELLLTPWGHESTHLGDEFSLAAQFSTPDEFRRINVSWEFWEVGLSYLKMRDNEDELTLRLGTTVLYREQPFALGNKEGSFYSVDPREANFLPVTPSNRAIESVWLQGQYVWDKDNWSPFLSVDVRERVVYDYDKPRADDKEQYGLGVNMLAGLLGNRDVAERGRVDPYVRAYYGVNSNGQFRNQRDYWVVGIGLSVDI